MSNIEEPNLFQLLTDLGLEYKDIQLYKTALTHRSYINENLGKNITQHNERLEFLGDAVLELIITEYLFHKYPEFKEGELTSFRSATVKTTSLAETSKQLGLGNYLFLSRGEEKTGGRERPYILANTFEAFLGAIFLDQGLSFAKAFLEKYLIPKIENIIKNRSDIDSKSKLQELAQDQMGITPQYFLISEEGPDHDKLFKMSVKIGTKTFGTGEGHNKQEAESNAAQEAINNWKK